ncbi:MAG: hypothetical protein LAT51_11995 [Flavobacteriaceae bacterium]|nr:hypothetical protein [Flavobacteriaceae bacterium]
MNNPIALIVLITSIILENKEGNYGGCDLTAEGKTLFCIDLFKGRESIFLKNETIKQH